jgi:hypothetical protein
MAGLAVETTKRLLFQEIPIIREKFLEKSVKPPRMDDRLQTLGGPHKPPDDPHNQDRALDIILFAHILHEWRIADKIVKVFLSLREKMNWSAVIYDQKQWNKEGVETQRLFSIHKKMKPDTKENVVSYEHLTHIHIEWRKENKDTAGFETELAKGLHKIILGHRYFYLSYGAGNPDLIRKQYDDSVKKIKDKGGKIADSLSVADFVVKIGEELPRQTGDPLETDLEKARMWKIPIIEMSELNDKL